MNQTQREIVEQFMRHLMSGSDVRSIISHAYMDDWCGNSFDFFVDTAQYDRDRYATTRIKAAIDRAVRHPDFRGKIVVDTYNYNTPRGGNSWKFSGIVKAGFSVKS